MKTNIVRDYTKPMFKIENIPVIRPRMQSRKYQFDKMKVGQSFYFEYEDFNDLNRVRSAASQYARRHGGKFSIVKEGNGYRCGRIE